MNADITCEQISYSSRKHTYIIFTPLTPLLCSKTEVYRGYTLFFLLLLENIDCGYSLEPPRRGGSNDYPQSILKQKYEKYQSFLSEHFQCLAVKFSIYLNIYLNRRLPIFTSFFIFDRYFMYI